MSGKILILILCFLVIDISAQDANSGSDSKNSLAASTQSADDLTKHLTAAESHQISGDLTNAAIENRAVLGIALQRYGKIGIEEGKYSDAIEFLKQSLPYADSAPNRTNLAIAYLRQNLPDEALREARIAVSKDPNHIGAHYILGNIYYAREDYTAALPELEKVFLETPDFEIGRALGFTYLSLKKADLARRHFQKLQALVGRESVALHTLFAKFYERTNYPADAERELNRALAIDPKTPKINLYLGYLLMQHGGSGRLAEAGEAFERELELNPNDFYSLFFAGVVASSENNHQKAIPLLEKAVDVNSESGEAHLFLAQSQIEIDDLENAEKNLRRAVELELNGGKNTQSRRTHFLLGRLLVKTGRREEGLKELTIAGKLQQAALDSSRSELERILGQVVEDSELKPGEEKNADPKVQIELTAERTAQLTKIKSYLANVIAQAFSNLGVIATQNNQLTDAIDYFSSAYQWKPDFPNLNRNLGIVTFRVGEFDQATGPLARQLETNPKDMLIRKLLGSSFYLTKDFQKSVETLKPIESQLEEDPELAYFYGISLVQLKRNKEALPVFERLAAVSKGDPTALFNAAQGFMMAGDFRRAVGEFERVLSIAPETPKANYFIGQCLIRLNQIADAEKPFSRELEISPADALSRYHLALTLIERKIEMARAVRLLEEATRLRYKYADAHYQLGKIYLEKGDYQKAIAQLESAVSADASKDYIHYQLSIAYRKVSRKEDADRELELYKKLKQEKRSTDTPMPMGGNENSPI